MIVDVRPGMSLAQVIVLLREAHGDSVTIRISPDSSLLLTANEFRALALAAEREQVAIAVETSDGHRRQLASLFGVPLAVPVEETPDSLDVLELVDDAGTLSPEEPIDFAALSHEVLGGTTTTTALPGEEFAQVRSKGSAGRGKSLSRLLLVVGLLVLIGIIGVAGYWFFFRESTITLTLQTEPVSSTLAFTVIRPEVNPATAPGAIPSEPVSFDLSVTLDAPATGTETIGGTAATGSVVLRNPQGSPVSIPAGTTIQTFEGVVFVFPEDVTVPGSADGGAGEATADIAAATPGAGGNVDTGMLSGRLPNGVYYSNRETPVAGGSDDVLTVVTQEDLDGLTTRAEETLRSLAATSGLSGNRRVVPSTLSIQDFTQSFSDEAGAEAETVTIEATISFDALAFSTELLDPAAVQALTGQTPPNHTLVTDSLVYQVPVETGEQNGAISLLTQVDGAASASISPEDLDHLIDSVSGKSEDEAIDLLMSDSRVTGVTIEFSPSWLPERLPSNSDRIHVELE